MTNIAVILAGGSGRRIGGGIPKQLLPLADGKSILEHAIYAFESAPSIHQIGVVMHKDYITQAQELVQRNGWHKVAWIIPGGNERWQSSVNAITKIQEDINNQLRVNQLINSQQGNDHLNNLQLINSQQGNNYLNNTQPITDENQINILLHDAARPFVTQQIIQDVCTALTHYQAVTVALPATDDCGIVHEYLPTTNIHIVPGAPSNRKITYPEDLKNE